MKDDATRTGPASEKLQGTKPREVGRAGPTTMEICAAAMLGGNAELPMRWARRQ
jgi:hypothetical protein